MAFSLALTRVNEEDALNTSSDPIIRSEAALRKAMFTAVTVLVLFTVFVQVRGGDRRWVRGGGVGRWQGWGGGGRENRIDRRETDGQMMGGKSRY